MENEFETEYPEDEVTSNTEEEEEEQILPGVIRYAAAEFSDLPHEEALESLKEIYSTTNWSDKTEAAKQFAEASDSINRLHEVVPKSDLQADFTPTLNYIFNEYHSDDERLNEIDKRTEEIRESIYADTDDVDKLMSARQKERELEALQMSLRRGIIAKDVGRLGDMIARGASAAISPLTGTVDAVWGTDFGDSLREYTLESTSADYDDSFVSAAASVVGGVGGFAASALIPGGPTAYMGAMLTNQSKEVYDQVYNETHDNSLAEAALLKSLPYNVVGTLGDEILGGMVSKLIKGAKGGVPGIVKTAAIGATLNVAQDYGVGNVIAEATSNPDFIPDERDLMMSAFAGGAVGGAIGAAGHVFDPARVQELKDGIRNKQANAERRKAKAKRSDKTEEEVIAEEEIAGASDSTWTVDPDGTVHTDGEGAAKETDIFRQMRDEVEAQARKEGLVDDNGKVLGEEGTDSPTNNMTDTPQNDAPNDAMPWEAKEHAANVVFTTHIAKGMGVKLAVATLMESGAAGSFSPDISLATGKIGKGKGTVTLLREMFKDPIAMTRTLNHEFAHSVDSAAAIEDGVITEPVTLSSYEKQFKELPVAQKMVRVYQEVKANSAEFAELNAQIDALNVDWFPYIKGMDAGKDKYRGYGSEQFANALSALLSEPAMVRDKYPLVWDAYSKAMDVHPELKKLVDLVNRDKTNPGTLYETYAKIKQPGQSAHARILKNKLEQTAAEKKAARKELPRKAFNWFRTTVSSKNTHAMDKGRAAVKIDPSKKEKIEENITRLDSVTSKFVNMHVYVDGPIAAAVNKLESEVVGSLASETPREVAVNLANLMDLTHVALDTNATVDEIKSNPSAYKDALFELSMPENANRPDLYERVYKLKDEELVREMAKIHASLTKNERENLRKKMAKDEQEFALKFLDEDAFNVRRLMANLGADADSAPATIASFKSLVGKKNYAHYDAALKEIHAVGYKVIADCDHAGLLDAKTKDKLVRNVDSYTPQIVMKYFEENPNISASIKKAIGNWDDTGNAIISFGGKAKAVLLSAAHQETQNATMNLVREFEPSTKYREIEQKKTYGKKKGKPAVFYESLFDTRAVLEKRNPDKSYIIEASEGKKHLFEVDDPGYANMFGPGVLEQNPMAKMVVGASAAINKMFITHWGKTLGSLSFGIASKFRDLDREAMIAKSKEFNWPKLVGLPIHADKALRAKHKDIRKQAKTFRSTGDASTLIQNALDHAGITWSLSQEFGGLDSKNSYEQGIFGMLGEDIPGKEIISIPDKVNKTLINGLRKLPFIKSMEEMMQIDELTTKLMAFDLALEQGRGPWEAGRIMRNWSGTPDPTGGGKEMGSVNKLFLFSRVHANGFRVLAEIARDDPKNFAFQYTYRKLIPRMMLSSALMGPIIGSLFGEEEEEVYRKYLDKISSYTKIGKSVIPVGFQDEDGVLRTLGSKINPKEITPNWKSVSINIPLERDLISVDQLNTPIFNAIEDLLATGKVSGRRIVEDVVSSMGQVFGGHMSQGLQTIWHAGLSEVAGHPSLLSGNPQDYFRKRGVLPQDVADAGTMYQKFSEYLIWSMYNNYPAMFGRRTKQYSTEPTSFFDQVAKVPQLGSLLKTFVTVTNYGDMEKSQEAEGQRKELDAKLRLNMGEATKALNAEASRYSGMIRRAGREDWKKMATPETKRIVRKILSYKATTYKDALDNMRDASMSGDTEKMHMYSDRLEKFAAPILKQVVKKKD